MSSGSTVDGGRVVRDDTIADPLRASLHPDRGAQSIPSTFVFGRRRALGEAAARGESRAAAVENRGL